MMKVIESKRYGNSSVLKVVERDKPQPGKHQVLIKVMAASVNPVDWKIRSGRLLIKTGIRPPKVLGSDFAGVVEAIGSQVNDYAVGDEVWGKFDSFKGGSYAQYVLARQHNISRKPANIDYFQAAAVPNVALTAYQAMVHRAGLQKGQQVLINGASGGVGLMAVQIARAMDCEVTAVCSEPNHALVKSMGAGRVLDYRTADILADTGRYKVFFDAVANQSFLRVRKTLCAGGVHIKTTPDAFSLLAQLIRFMPVKRPDHIMVKPSSADLCQLRQWVESEQLKPLIQQIFPLYEVAQAHDLSETGRVVGKLVLDMQAQSS
jgi:NADPH:quinone reductase-like Zn-dependent oxidoreductase